MLALFLAAIPCVLPPAESTELCKDTSTESLEKVTVPGVTIGVRGAGTASATRAPWVNSNGFRFLLKPDVKYLYELPKGKAALAAAEAYAFDANARLRIAPEDAKPLADMLAFLKKMPAIPGLKPAANIAVIDTGSKALPEVVNLMVRRNLLCRVVTAPDSKADLNVRIGSPEFPEAEAANPVAVADKARQMLTDKKRLLRIYGTETMIGRLYTGAGVARLHLLNYASSSVAGIRIRVRGPYKTAASFEGPKLDDVTTLSDAIEFTVSEMGPYAVVDLK